MNTQNQTSRRTRVLKIALAGIAVAGIGAAITTAAWTDEVLFSATATASSFDLQGAWIPEGGTCDGSLDFHDVGDLDAVTDIVNLTTAALSALEPDEVVDVPFCLYNAGNLAGTLTGPVDLDYDNTLPLASVTVTDLAGTAIAAGGYVAGTLTVTTPNTWTDDQFGDTATITFSVTGTSGTPTP